MNIKAYLIAFLGGGFLGFILGIAMMLWLEERDEETDE